MIAARRRAALDHHDPRVRVVRTQRERDQPVLEAASDEREIVRHADFDAVRRRELQRHLA